MIPRNRPSSAIAFRLEVPLPQGLLVERRRAAVDAALLRVAVAQVVLDDAAHAGRVVQIIVRVGLIALQPADGGDAHQPAQVGIFTEALLEPAEARVREHVHDGAETDVAADGR